MISGATISDSTISFGDCVLDRFYSHLTNNPHCTNDLAKGISKQWRGNAQYSRYIELNQRLNFYLAFDLDFVGSAICWESANLPPPTIVISNPENAHAHLLYELRAPICATEKGRLKPLKYLRAVYEAYRIALHGDAGYVGLMVKNPLHCDWRVMTHNVDYDLEELSEWVELPTGADATVEVNWLGRNCTLFDSLRKWAYWNVSKYSEYDAWQMAICRQAEKINQYFSPSLPLKEVDATASSVAEGTWRYREQIGTYRKGILGLEPIADSLTEPEKEAERKRRMGMGAKQTHKMRQGKTELAILDAIAALGLQLYSLRMRDRFRIAEHAGINPDTVKRFFRTHDIT